MARRRLAIAAVALLAAAPTARAQGSIPTAEQLATARPAAIRAMAECVLATVRGDTEQATVVLLNAAHQHEDHATRYLLWQQALELAKHHKQPRFAESILRSMADEFGIDPVTGTVELLRDMAATAADHLQRSRVALSAMYVAADYNAIADDRPMLAFIDVASRAALRTGHAPLYGFVRDRLTYLRTPRRLAASVAPHIDAESDNSALLLVDSLLVGSLPLRGSYRVAQLAPLFGGMRQADDIDPDRDASSLTGEELQRLAAAAPDPHMRLGWLRLARNRFGVEYRDATPERRTEICTSITGIVEQLCKADGLSRLRFAHATQLEQMLRRNGEWRIEDGLLVGKATGADNFATHRVRFAHIEAAVIRGGIRSEAGLNFRCQVGNANLLFNWEVEPQNHLWLNGNCLRATPPAMTAGEEHTVLLFSDGQQLNVCVDGRHLFATKCMCSGTITVYPALGSEIFVREILIDGYPEGLVDAPAGVLM